MRKPQAADGGMDDMKVPYTVLCYVSLRIITYQRVGGTSARTVLEEKVVEICIARSSEALTVVSPAL